MSKRLNVYQTAKRPGTDYNSAVWERDVRRQAFKNWRWIVLVPVLVVFTAVAIVVFTK